MAYFKKFRKSVGLAFVAIIMGGILLVPTPTRAVTLIPCAVTSIAQIVEIVVNAIGFILWSAAIDQEVGDSTDGAASSYSSRNVAAIEELRGVIEQQNAFSQLDNDDFEINDHLELFSQSSGEALKMAYLHYIAATAGLPGSQQAGEMLTTPLYGSPSYEFNKKLLNATFNMRKAENAAQVYFGEFNHAPAVPHAAAQEQAEQQALYKLQAQLDKVIAMLEDDSLDAVTIERLTAEEKILALNSAQAVGEVR